MTAIDLITLVAEEFHFEVEAAQFRFDDIIIRRISKNPSYRTEYALVRLEGDIITVTGSSKSEQFSLCNPGVFEQLSLVLDSSVFLCGSLATMDVPVANRVLL
jgi:hypothetical protein